MSEFSKHVAIVKISEPSAVKAKCSSVGQQYDNGAIWVEIPELDFVGTNLIYCRYGLSLPYLRVQNGWKLWVEPTIGETERWIYVGIVDAGEEDFQTMQVAITLATGFLYMAVSGNTIHISDKGANEPFILGNKFKTWLDNFISAVYNAHTHTCSAPGSPSSPPIAPATTATDIYSTKIFGK